METAVQQMKLKKPPNKNIGEVLCTYCCTKQPVRRNAKGKLYINCSNCGVIQPALRFFQEWIFERCNIYGAEKPDPAPAAPPAKSPEPDTHDTPHADPLPLAAQAAPAKTEASAAAKPAKKNASGFGMFRRG